VKSRLVEADELYELLSSGAKFAATAAKHPSIEHWFIAIRDAMLHPPVQLNSGAFLGCG
jgi:hypothetical protein